MRNLISILFALLLTASVCIQSCNNQDPLQITSANNEKVYALLLDPCCNQNNPDSTIAPTYHVFCSGGDVQIDSQCCVNLWDFFDGPPPPSMNCTIIGIQCPESK